MNVTIFIVLLLPFLIAGKVSKYIYGGKTAYLGQFPYIASLQCDNFGGRQHMCGGAILNEKYIITAADCIRRHIAKECHVKVGMILIFSGDKYDIEKGFKHPFGHNIALIRVKGEIKYHKNVQSIDIGHGNLDEWSPVTIMGWGRTSRGDESSILFYAKASTMTYDRCRSLRKKINDVLPSRICTRGHPQGVGTCTTDLGGPLVDHRYLIGIAVTAEPCGTDLPDEFEGVSKYVNWINCYLENKPIKLD